MSPAPLVPRPAPTRPPARRGTPLRTTSGHTRAARLRVGASGPSQPSCTPLVRPRQAGPTTRLAGILAPSKILLVFVAFSLFATAAFAAVTVTYATNSSTTLGTIAAPVVYSAGADNSNRYVTGWSLSNNATYFSVNVDGVPEANLTIGELFKITNQDTDAHTLTLTLTGGVVSNANIDKLEIHFFDDSNDAWVKKWDLETSSTVSLTSMAASKVYYAKVYVELASGAGDHNVAESLAVQLTVA